MGMKPPWTVVRNGRGIVISKANRSNRGTVETDRWKLFSQFADAQSMMHRFSNKVARLKSYFRDRMPLVQTLFLTMERLQAL